MEEKKEFKKKNGLVVVVVLLIIIVIGLGGYIAVDKLDLISTKKTEVKSKTDKKEQKEEIKTLSYDEGNKLLEKIKVINNNFASSFPLSDFSKINNQDLLLFVANQVGFGTDFSMEKANEIISNIFGSSVTLKHEDIMCSIDNKPYYTYDSSVRKYVYNKGDNVHPHGGLSTVDAKTYYVNGKYNSSDEIEINTKVLYSNICGDTCMIYEYYANYNHDNETPILESKDGSLEVTDEMYEQVKNRIPVTSYIFKKNKDNSYDLKSVTIK